MRLKIQIRFSFIMYMICAALFSSAYCCGAIALSLLVHELGHYITGTLLGERIVGLELTPFGGILSYMPGETPHKGIRGILVAVSGPLANGLLLVLSSFEKIIPGLPAELRQEIILANLAMIALNMLPVLPLDGGQILFCVGYYLFPIGILITVLSYAGAIVGFLFLSIPVWFCLKRGSFNCSLFIIGLYLVMNAKRCKESLLVENVLTIIQERYCEAERIRKIHAYSIPKRTPLCSLLVYIKPPKETVFVIENTNPPSIVTEHCFFKLLRKKPTVTIGEALQDTNCDNFQNKSCFYP